MRLITPDCPLFTARFDDSPFDDDPFWAFVWAGCGRSFDIVLDHFSHIPEHFPARCHPPRAG